MFYKLIILSALVITCASRQISKNNQPSYVRIATEKFLNDIIYVFNPAKSHVLCVKSSKSTQRFLYPPLVFFIYDIRNEKIVYGESLNNGSIKWVNDTQIEVSLIPGVVSGLEEIDKKARGFVYDLTTHKKIYGEIEDRK